MSPEEQYIRPPSLRIYLETGGDLTGITDPLGRTTTRIFDNAGRTLAVTDPSGNTTRYSYDGDNQLTSRQLGGTGLTPLRFDLAYTARNQVGTLTRYSDLAGTTKVGESDSTYDTAGRLGGPAQAGNRHRIHLCSLRVGIAGPSRNPRPSTLFHATG